MRWVLVFAAVFVLAFIAVSYFNDGDDVVGEAALSLFATILVAPFIGPLFLKRKSRSVP